MPSLIVIRGQQPGRILPLDAEIVLGRGSKASLQLPDPSLSRQHCRLSPREKRWHIEDLHSTNGVYVNGQHVQQRHELKAGDLITLGHVQLLFSEEQCCPATESAPETSEEIPPGQSAGPDAAFASNAPQQVPAATDSSSALLEISRLLDELPGKHPPQPADFQLMAPWLAELAQPLQRMVLIWHDKRRNRLLTLVQGGDSPLQARLDLPLLQFATTHGQTLLSLAADTDPRLPVRHAGEKLGMKSLICIPVIRHKDVVGLLLADSTESEPQEVVETTFDRMQLLARLLAPVLENDPAPTDEPAHTTTADTGLHAWQKQHLDGQPPFLPQLQWLQSHPHQEHMLTALNYHSPEPGRHLLLAMDAQGQHHPRLRNLLLDELCVWLDATLPHEHRFDQLAESLVHRSLGLPVSLRWCLLEADSNRQQIRWYNHQLCLLQLDRLQSQPLPEQGRLMLEADGPTFILGNRQELLQLPWNQWPELAPALLSRADATLAEMPPTDTQSGKDHFLVILQAQPR